jgi:hypothetical protein
LVSLRPSLPVSVLLPLARTPVVFSGALEKEAPSRSVWFGQYLDMSSLASHQKMMGAPRSLRAPFFFSFLGHEENIIKNCSHLQSGLF